MNDQRRQELRERLAKADTYSPPEGVRSAARRALKLIADGHAGGGFTDVGRKRASDLAAGRSVSLETVKRMHSYFSRHEVDKQGKDWNNKEKPSPGKVAWLAWGGDAGKSWAASIVNRVEKGEKQGHKFRGNQYTHGKGSGNAAKKSLKEQAEEHLARYKSMPYFPDKEIDAYTSVRVVDSRTSQKAMYLRRSAHDPNIHIVDVNGHQTQVVVKPGLSPQKIELDPDNQVRRNSNLKRRVNRVEKGEKQGHKFRGNQYTKRGAGAKSAPIGHERVETFGDGVQAIVSDPVEALAAKHGVKKDWSKVTCVDPKKRAQIADFYDKAPDVPADKASPEVKKAYAALTKEVDEQYRVLTEELGVKVEFTDEDPYRNYSEMYKDFVENKRLKIMKTASTGSHPLMTDEQNDRLRAVHDAFGHLGTGRGFDRHGEEAAYQAHKSMFSPEAQKAAATELRGQNSFLIEKGYFGPQKLVIMPEELRKRLLTLLEKMYKSGDVQQHNDDDNAYESTGSHHVSCGRVLNRVEKGEKQGHKFRGNQYTKRPGAKGGAVTQSSAVKPASPKGKATPKAEEAPAKVVPPVVIDADDDTMDTYDHLTHNLGMVNAEELSWSTGVPVRKTKDILNRLVKHGFAHKTKIDRVDHYYPAKRVHAGGKVAVGLRRMNGGNWVTDAHQDRIEERRESMRSAGIGGRRG